MAIEIPKGFAPPVLGDRARPGGSNLATRPPRSAKLEPPQEQTPNQLHDRANRSDSTRSATPSRRADIQGLRGLAVVLVVLYHTDRLLPGGFIGVDVFFVISGYVITAMLLRELTSTGTVDFVRFYSRRISRLLPVLAVALTATSIASSFVLSPFGPQQQTAETGIAASLFSANAQLYLSPGGYFEASSEINPLLHTWSLAVEEQFYLGFPLIVFFGWILGRRFGYRRTLPMLLVVAGIFSLAVSVLFAQLGDMQPVISEARQFAFYASPARAWEFVAGAVLAFGTGKRLKPSMAMGQLLSIGGVAVILLCAFTYDDFTTFPGITALPPVLGTMALIVGGGIFKGGVSGLLSTKPAVFIGDVSYSWYLWHWPAIVFASVLWGSLTSVLLAAFASLPLAWLSYVGVEEPFRHSTRWLRWRAVPLMACCVLIPIATMLGLSYGAERNWGSPEVEELATYSQLHGDVIRGCDESQGIAWDAERCTWNSGARTGIEINALQASPAASGSILLVGDSHAGQLTEAVTDAGTSMGLETLVRTRSACPFADIEFSYRNGSDSELCSAYVSKAVDYAIESDVSAVVISTASAQYLVDGSIAFEGDDQLDNDDADERAAFWRSGFERLTDRLISNGIEVLVVQPLPTFDHWSLAACPTFTMVRQADSCGTEISRADALAKIAPYSSENRDLASASEGLAVVDLFDSLCPGAVCETNSGYEFFYRDADHISVPTSQRLSADFQTAFAKLGSAQG